MKTHHKHFKWGELEALCSLDFHFIRHEHTNYDELLMKFGDRGLARVEVREKIEAVLDRWESPAAPV